MADNTSKARIHVASLSDYTKGSIISRWFDFSDYPDGETLRESIHEFLDEIQKEKGGETREEYIVLDYENFPQMYYSEYMSEGSFDDVYEFIRMTENVPAAAVEGFVDYGHDLEHAEEAYYGEFENARDFAENYVDGIGGVSGINDPEYYFYMSDTDRRIYAGEEAYHLAEDMEVEEFYKELDREDEYDPENPNDALDQQVREDWEEQYAEKIQEELDDPYDYFVNQQGMYSPNDFLESNVASFDYDKFANDLLINDYFAVDGKDGGYYVFSRHY